MAKDLSLVLHGNLIGAVFVACFHAVQTGGIGAPGASGSAGLTYDRLASVSEGKALHESPGFFRDEPAAQPSRTPVGGEAAERA